MSAGIASACENAPEALRLPALGQGTCFMGEDPVRFEREAEALRLGVELGMGLIDTAEMYGDGLSESFIGEALSGIPRSRYMLCTKVLPQYAGRADIYAHCEASLRRLRADFIDLYLLHWLGDVPLGETVDALNDLQAQGLIRRWGVSNFDAPDMERLFALPGGKSCAADEVMYNITSRGIEYDLLPWAKAHGVSVIAYCPLAQAGALSRMGGDINHSPALSALGQKYGLTPMQVALAFTVRDGVCAIPKASSAEHVRANAQVACARITPEDWRAVDAEFWPPSCKMHLDIE